MPAVADPMTPERAQLAALASTVDAWADWYDETKTEALARWLYDCGVRAPEPTCGVAAAGAPWHVCALPPLHRRDSSSWHMSAPVRHDGMWDEGRAWST